MSVDRHRSDYRPIEIGKQGESDLAEKWRGAGSSPQSSRRRGGSEMKFGKLMAGFALALVVVAAISAAGASAAAVTEPAEWYIGASPGSTLTEDRVLTASASTGTTFKLRSVVSGTTLEITMTGLECVECKITNSPVTEKAGAVAMGRGKLKFTGVSVDTPANCTVRNGSSGGAAGLIETKPLVFHVDWMHEGKWFQHWFAATSNILATFQLEGASCPLAATYNLKGTVFSQSKNNTGVQAASHEFLFSPTIQATAGGEMSIGASVAELTGSGIFSAGGIAFGAH
jgi:hypothetical protein